MYSATRNPGWRWRGDDPIVVIENLPKLDEGELEDLEHEFYARGYVKYIATIRSGSFLREPFVVSLSGLGLRGTSDLIRKISSIELRPELLQAVWVATSGMPAAIEIFARCLKDSGVEAATRMIRGVLFDVEESSSGLWLPSDAAPRIVSVNEDLIKRLKLEPESIYQLTPRKFEEILADLLTDMGMEVELTQASKDDGRDIMAKFDAGAGKMLCLVEAKRYRKDRKVGIELVKQLFGTLCDSNATSAMLVTTSSFTDGAKEFQKKYEWKMGLRDYCNVVEWIEGYKTGKNRKLMG